MTDRHKQQIREDLQKKLAEQLSEKMNMSSKEIEEGVNKFIQSSQESLGGIETKPPYRRVIWYETFFKMIQQKTISKISLEFISLNITSVRSEAYKFRNGLLFFNLIDSKSEPTSKLEKLRVTGEAFIKNFSEIVHQSYSDLFNTVYVEQAKPESLVNYMIQRYGYSKARAEEATALFVYFCSKANIPISEELAVYKPKVEKREWTQTTKQTTKKDKKESKIEYEYDVSFATLKFDEFSFAVKKDLSAIEFARSQVNSLLDYLTNKLRKEEPKE